MAANRQALMARPCTVCNHPQRAALDVAMVGGQSARGLARQYNVSRDALARHQDHISAALTAVRQDKESAEAESLLERVEALILRAESFLSAAERTGQVAQGLAAIRELRALLELLGRASGELKPDGPTTVVNILQSPEIARYIGAVRDVLADDPERLAAISDRLALPA